MVLKQHVITVLLATLLTTTVTVSSVAQEQSEPPPIPEIELKAEFIWRFTLYVEWPPTVLRRAGTAPFVIGIVGGGPMIDALTHTVRGRQIKERQVVIRQVVDLETLPECHIIFITSSAEPELDRVLDRTRGRPVLTISDSTGFASRGVIINFFLDGDQLRFEINETSARASGLELRSKLMQVSHIVRDVPP